MKITLAIAAGIAALYVIAAVNCDLAPAPASIPTAVAPVATPILPRVAPTATPISTRVAPTATPITQSTIRSFATTPDGMRFDYESAIADYEINPDCQTAIRLYTAATRLWWAVPQPSASYLTELNYASNALWSVPIQHVQDCEYPIDDGLGFNFTD